MFTSKSCLRMLVLALLATQTYAQENWQKIFVNDRTLIEMNTSSLTLGSLPNLIKLQWRSKDSLGTTLNVAEADCSNFTLYMTDTYTTNAITGFSRRIDDKYGTYGPSYLPYSEHLQYGIEIRTACLFVKPEAIKKLTARPTDECAKPANVVTENLCKFDDEFRANERIMFDRLMTMGERCEENNDDVMDILLSVEFKTNRCTTNECAIDSVKDAQQRATNDLLAVNRWRDKTQENKIPNGTCKFVNQMKNELADEKSHAEGMAILGKYRQCIENNVSKLDDGQSSADIIVKGLHSTCLELFEKGTNMSNKLRSPAARQATYKGMEPYMIALVLKNRANSRAKKK